MTANKLKRIRKRLEDAARLTQEAYELAAAEAKSAFVTEDYELVRIAARAVDDMQDCMGALEHYDQQNRIKARQVERDNAPIEVGDLVASKPTDKHQVVGTVRSITPLDNAIIDIRHTVIDGQKHEPRGRSHTILPLSLLFRIYE